MRVVSMVPSWTETLLEAGVDVVGRTRFCIHPADIVKGVPVVGGTKSWDLEKVRALAPDVVLLDREENPRELAAECPVPYVDTHVSSLETLASELDRLAALFGNERLADFARELRAVLGRPRRSRFLPPPGLQGLLGDLPAANTNDVVYLIWKDPWMAAGRGTFIASVLEFLGARLAPLPEGKYPRVGDDVLRSGAILLFSSEPYPFEKKRRDLEATGLGGFLVDGEGYSWFGIRAINFLKKSAP